MPELPDITVHVEALRERVLDAVLERVRLASPFVLRTVTPPLAAVEGRRVLDVRRLGKRIVLAVEGQEGPASTSRTLGSAAFAEVPSQVASSGLT